jgi:hypothetical protein
VPHAQSFCDPIVSYGDSFSQQCGDQHLRPISFSHPFKVIEKAFNQQEQKLDEPKAWSASEEGKRIQAIAMCIVHNLLRLFGAKLKIEEDIEDTKVIKAWQKDLGKRMEKARAAGRHLPVELYQALYSPTEVSLQFIRWYG